MIFPIMLFENHLIPSSMHFLDANVTILKDLGYKKFLFELDKETRPEDMKRQLSFLYTGGGAGLMQGHIRYMLSLWEKLDRHDIKYEFIDPESEKNALRHNIPLKDFHSGVRGAVEIKKAQILRQQATDERDEYIARKLISDSEYYKGGVVYTTGFMHTNLLVLLEKHRQSYFRFVTLTSSRIEEKVSAQVYDPDMQKWLCFRNPLKRLNHFKTSVVKYFDLDTSPSFELIAASCQFTQRTKIDPSPYIGRFFEEATKRSWDFFMDESSVLTASTVTSLEEERNLAAKLTKQFPSLFFFEETKREHVVISVSGLNLPESCESLSAVFRIKA